MAGGNQTIRDSSNDRFGVRMRPQKDKSGNTDVPYSSGHVMHWQKTDDGDGKKGSEHRIKETRTLISVSIPHEVWITNAGDSKYGDRYDRAFQKGKYAIKEGEGQ